MSNLLYLASIILIIVWATGYFAYDAGNLIHVLLIIAIIVIFLRAVRGKNPI
ncbi:MAG: lmo0937 family membrane protein [Saprospiraceae bacterium]|nr:lmo0937 family membrane protein [Saprospiraceae bacterium]